MFLKPEQKLMPCPILLELFISADVQSGSREIASELMTCPKLLNLLNELMVCPSCRYVLADGCPADFLSYSS
jgi:hypothetical protein